jgi:hypothetical protein
MRNPPGMIVAMIIVSIIFMGLSSRRQIVGKLPGSLAGEFFNALQIRITIEANA